MRPLFPRTPRLDGQDSDTKRAEILRYFHATFDRTESLFEHLSCDEAYFRKPIGLRHPLIFYFGHTAAFFTNKFVLAGLTDGRIDPRLESAFAIGVDEMSWDDLDDTRYDWPTVAEVREYRQRTRAMVDRVIRTAPLTLPVGWTDPFWIVLMGIEHERIHIETSSVLIRQHDLNYVRPLDQWPACPHGGPAPDNALMDIPAGRVSLGRRFDDPVYGWDNEYGEHHADIPTFQAGRYLVTNREFLSFVEDGGYADDSLWDAEGAGWKAHSRAEHPTFWVAGADGWKLRLLARLAPMPWDWPVEVNCLEARAFCRWMARRTGLAVRLPTEDEWNRLYDRAGLGDVPHDAPADANLHLDHWASACPVTTFRHGDLFDVVGNVWQWCDTPTYPFAGFDVHPVYDDFTVPTFDDRHNLIKGGSWASTGNESRHASRYAFRRHFFQHAGFRYVVGDRPAAPPASAYEADALVSQYAEFHYGDEVLGVPNFPKAMADIAADAHRRLGNGRFERALDLGCATGRASFELARAFGRVVGLDFSARFIQVGTTLAETGHMRYTIQDEGELVSRRDRRLDTLGLDGTRDRVEFWQADACNLNPKFAGFDLILAANLIDRLYRPRQCLTELSSRLTPGGLLVLASPYTWMEEHTKREDWIGGFTKDGVPYTTLDGLKDVLGPLFDLVQGPQSVPFVIRETKRKAQHTLSEVTVWKRKAVP